MTLAVLASAAAARCQNSNDPTRPPARAGACHGCSREHLGGASSQHSALAVESWKRSKARERGLQAALPQMAPPSVMQQQQQQQASTIRALDLPQLQASEQPFTHLRLAAKGGHFARLATQREAEQ
ncbi:unnamed protein product [Lampetra fluviatilis]